MLLNGLERAYACKCLNVRIRPQPPPAESESSASNVEYTQVYVGDEGISVAHPQVTLRTRSPGIPIAGTTKCARYTSLTCLVCHTLVYRVHQVVPLDVEGKDGPQLPTDDWVEKEVMKSVNGWIEVHQGSITGDAIAQAQSSKSYSTVFGVVLPPPRSLSSLIPEQPYATDSEPLSPRPPRHPVSYLSDMQPLFPPPPFTPSHPVFLHLSSVAISKSQDLRASAEEYLSNVIAEKTKELEQADAQLRQYVESLWKAFREGVGKLEQGTSHRLPSKQKDSENRTDASGGTSSSIPRVSVHDFVPVQSRPARTRLASPLPRVSSLSASLVTTSFHHPRAEQTSPSPPAALVESTPSSSPGSRTLSPSSVISSLTLRSQAEAIGGLEPFKRNMDQARDTAASFRYFTILETDMARAAREREQGTETKTDMAQTLPDVAQGSRGVAQGSSSITNGHKKASGRRLSSSQSNGEVPANSDGKPEEESGGATSGPLTNGSKGKRKVTFDVKPDVVTIKREVNAEKEEEAGQDVGEMIFDLEDEISERFLPGSASRPLLPLLEHAPVRARPRISRRPGSTTGLPGSFSTLRPTSLPAPPHMRPPRGHNANDASHSMLVPQTMQPITNNTQYSAPEPESEILEDPEPLDPREAEILKLVAADTPSHRGAWTRNSKAWQLFVRRQDDKSGYSSMIPEEFESSDFETGVDDDSNGDDDDEVDAYNEVSTFVGSLPININPPSQPKPPLSLASYQPEALIATSKRSELVSPRGPSSTALRRAAYAQRDRTRSMDPGALDFDATIEEEDVSVGESDNETANPTAVDNGDRGRKLALKILQARSELPEPGMWRSLA